MNEDDDGSLGADLWVDDEGLEVAAADMERDVLAMARRGFEAGLGPILRVDGKDGQGEQQGGG